MKRQAHVAKTPKGSEEIQTRAHKLDRHLRHVLILVDGVSTVEEIEAKGEGMPDIVGSLAQLASQGFILIEGEHPVLGEDADVSAAKAELIAIATELLGPDAGNVVSRLQAAPDTKEALLEVASQCKKIVKLIIDETKAEELMRRCSDVIARL